MHINMASDDDTRRVHFNSPERLVERADAMASLLHKDRTDLLNEALREYIEETAEQNSFQQLVANEYYEDRLNFESVEQLVGPEIAQRFRLLKADLEGETLDLDAPTDTDIYDGERRTVEPAGTDSNA